MTDTISKHSNGEFSVHTPDMGVIGGFDSEQEAKAMLADIAAVRRQGPCTKCGHLACPFCKDWCDVLSGGPDDDDPCCDMACIYKPAECTRCGFVVCACVKELRPEPLELELEPSPALPVRASLFDEPEGYSALHFMGADMLPKQGTWFTSYPQRPMRGPYRLLLSLRDCETGELLPVEFENITIAGCLIGAASVGGGEPPATGPDVVHCIPLQGPMLVPSLNATFYVRNISNRRGKLRASLYGVGPYL